MKLSDELKEAIKALSEKEKDKLLLRLIPKSSLLVQQLEFQLIEGGTTTALRREELKDKIQGLIDNLVGKNCSPGYLLMIMRELTSRINNHVSVTKDKFGDIELNLLMIEGLFNGFQSKLNTEDYYDMDKFNEYIIKRMIKVLKLIEKMHEDYYSDYRGSINTIGRLMTQTTSTATKARYMSFDISTLTLF